MNFMFSWQEQYLTRSLRSLVRYCSCHSNIKFMSSRHHVISSIYHIFKQWKVNWKYKSTPEFFDNLAEFVFEFFCESRRIFATFAKFCILIRFSQHNRTVTQIPDTSSSARSRSPPSPTQVFWRKQFLQNIFPPPNWRPSCKKGVYQILADFHFLPDWANFWQTDLFWHEKHCSVIVSVDLRFVLQK